MPASALRMVPAAGHQPATSMVARCKLDGEFKVNLECAALTGTSVDTPEDGPPDAFRPTE